MNQKYFNQLLKLVFTLTISVLINSCSGPSTTLSAGSIPAGAEVQEYSDVDGLVHVVLRDNDQITAEGDFLDGLEHGAWTEYDAEGRISRITSYYRGLKQGVSITFNNNEVKSKAYFHNGELDGESLQFDRRKVIEQKTYKAGELTGAVKKFYKDGTVMEEANYENGQLNGIAKWYNQQGELTIAYRYEDGELVDKDPVIED